MKRTIKNTIMIVLCVLCIGAFAGTAVLAKNNLSATTQQTTEKANQSTDGSNGMMDPSQNSNQGGTTDPSQNSNGTTDSQTPPEMPSGDMSNGDASSTQQNGDSTTPPDKPEGEADSTDGSTSPEMPSGNASTSQDGTQPTMPEGDTANGQQNSDSSQSSGNNSMPSMPGQNSSNGMQQPQGGDMGMMGGNTQITLTPVYMVAFGVEGFLFACIFMYLLLSHFNKFGVKETFKNVDKVLVYILSIALIVTYSVLGSTVGMNKFVLNSGTASQQQQQQNSSVEYDAANEITTSTSVSSETYKSTKADQNALSISGDIDVDTSDLTITKSGDSDGGDNTSFYGTNAAVIVKEGARATFSNVEVTTDATGANGIFCYGGSATTNNTSSDGTSITVSESTITTSKDNSGGIMTTGGGETTIKNCTITTAGTSSAAIRTDRGGGTVVVKKGTYTTTGKGSPAVYSTADITVKNATLDSQTSEGIVIEGKNSVALENCTLTDSNTELNGQSTTYKNIFLYQSVSGDADEGTSEFSATNSTITTEKGDTFYITNTSANITLSGNTFVNNDESGNFLRAQADSWGNEGSNGGQVTLTMEDQEAEGNIVVDSVSTLDMTMKASTYTGCINADNTAKSLKLTVDKDSKITLTGDCYLTEFSDEDTSYANINFNGFKIYVNGTSIN